MKNNQPVRRLIKTLSLSLCLALSSVGVAYAAPSNGAPPIVEKQINSSELPKLPGYQAEVANSASRTNSEKVTDTAAAAQPIFNEKAGLWQDGSRVLTAQDILTFGDSQVYHDSWVGLGMYKAGYKPVMYNCGGVGFVYSRPGECSSYTGGIVNNEWKLPTGTPRAIYIQGSGNDSGSDSTRKTALTNASQVIDKLKLLYPNTQIIITSPISANNPKNTHRFIFSDMLRGFAQSKSITFITYERWVTDFGAQKYLVDDRHFGAEGHQFLAQPMADSLTAALKGFTQVGGITDLFESTGGPARFGVPTSNESRSEGGTLQSFSKNHTFFWSPQTNSHFIWWGGAVGQKFAALGAEKGPGFPLEEETFFAYGTRQSFLKTNGAQLRFYWAPNTGVHILNGRGAIFQKWVNDGHANSVGFPLADEKSHNDGGYSQLFRSRSGYESMYYWAPGIAAHKMNANGAIYHMYTQNGFTAKFGYPTTDEYVDSKGVYHVKFSKGYDINWTAGRGVRVN